MDIIVHGTKLGWETFTEKDVSGLLDVTPDTVTGSALGQEAYGIRFIEKYVIFSKYMIIRDVRGAKRIGFLAFSLVLSNNEKLSGKDIIALLDQVLMEYCQEYIPENDNNLKGMAENWSFLDHILNKYKNKLRNIPIENVENLHSGIKDDSFIYYKNDEELQKYFDVPYQDEYAENRQVLFVKEELNGKLENPLNALRHSENNLTGKIDLENPIYKLLFYQETKAGIKIDVKINGKTLFNKNKVKGKDDLEITWSKKYHETFLKEGKWSEMSSEFIHVDDNLETVSIKEIELRPKTKTITFKIQNRKGEPETNAEIIYKSGDDKRIETLNQITFIGKELGQLWTVSAKKGPDLFSIEKSIDPKVENQIDLVLKEHKKVKFSGELEESNRYFQAIKISIKGKNTNYINPEAVFIDDEIEDRFQVIATYQNGDENFYGEKFFYPKDSDSVKIKLQKVIKRKYIIEVGERGEKSTQCPGWSNYDDGKDVGGFIKGKSGWKFVGFKLENIIEQSDLNGVLIAQFKKENFFPQLKIIAATVVGVLVLLVGLWYWLEVDNSIKITEEKINQYVEGVELNSHILRNYKSQWKGQEPEIIKIQGSWLSVFGIGSEVEIYDSTEYKIWQVNLKSIDSAILKRDLINKGNFSEIKNLNFSYEQEKFKNVIECIDSTKYEYIGRQLLNEGISYLTLNEIADMISSLETHIQSPDDYIISYLEGIDLYLNILQEYKQQTSSESIKERIDKSIEFRKNLKLGEVSQLITSDFQYSKEQIELKDAINLLDDNNKSYVGNAMNRNSISSMNLDDIAKFIREKIDEYNGKSSQQKIKSDKQLTMEFPGSTYVIDNSNDISKELNSGDISIERLQVLKGDLNMERYQNSIELYLEFWNLVNYSTTQKKSFDVLLQKVRNDSIMKNSELKMFLDSIIINNEAFLKYKMARGKATIATISGLKDII